MVLVLLAVLYALCRQDEEDSFWHQTAARPWDPPLSVKGRVQVRGPCWTAAHNSLCALKLYRARAQHHNSGKHCCAADCCCSCLVIAAATAAAVAAGTFHSTAGTYHFVATKMPC